jgi:hypothetical protein
MKSKRLLAVGSILMIVGIVKLFTTNNIELFDYFFPTGLGAGVFIFGLILMNSEKK